MSAISIFHGKVHVFAHDTDRTVSAKKEVEATSLRLDVSAKSMDTGLGR